MLITEFYMTRSDGVQLFRTYSDEDRKLIQNETGIVYSEAIDIEGSPYTYTESEEFNEHLPEHLESETEFAM